MTTTAAELEKAFKGPGFGLTFLYYFGVATLIVAIATMQILQVGAQSALPYQYGIAFALPFGLINAITKHSRTLTVSFKKPSQFSTQLKSVLSELGFKLQADPEVEDGVTYQTFRKAGLAGWLSETVYVAIADREAVIASRSRLIKKLEDKF